MNRKIFLILLAAMFLSLELAAQSFTFNYRGVDFKCRVKSGKATVAGFDHDAAKVVVPAQVKDKRGKSYPVYSVDLFAEAVRYRTNTVVIEPGITEIEEYCFKMFPDLAAVYIPNSIEKIGKNAFRGKKNMSFNMPGTIREDDLRAGNVVYPHVAGTAELDPMAGLDLSAYGAESNNGSESSDDVAAAPSKPVGIAPGTSDIDFNIPIAGTNRDNTFCLIIANESYKQSDTPNVKYAAQDGKTFESYCLRTLGLPRENIRMATNASYTKMNSMLQWIKEVADVYGKDANVIVYYAGHGVPDEKGNCKLVPADVSINDVNNGFSLKDLYSSLGKLSMKNVLLLIDACFSGNDRGDVAAVDEMHRGLARKVQQESVSGNVVVLTAASGTETALSYDEKAHGLFSYYLMKKLQDTKGDVTYGELFDYIKKEVVRKSVVAKGKKQTPSISVSGKMLNSWKNIKF